jgi:hypothetical protein
VGWLLATVAVIALLEPWRTVTPFSIK